MAKTKRPARRAGRVVYVLDAWDDARQRSVLAVFATRVDANRALARLVNRPGDWYAGVVKRTVR
jgi:hypothetical protein